MDFTKAANGDERAELGAIGVLEIELSWEQPQTGNGLLGKAMGRLTNVDIDVAAILFEGTEPVDYVDPKTHPVALNGSLIHHGDVRRGAGEGGGERITMQLANIRAVDADITAIAIVAACAKGDFSKVAGAVCRFAELGADTPDQRRHLGNVRFSVMGEHTGALLGVVRKDAGFGWSFTKTRQYGRAGTWRQLASLAQGHVS